MNASTLTPRLQIIFRRLGQFSWPLASLAAVLAVTAMVKGPAFVRVLWGDRDQSERVAADAPADRKPAAEPAGPTFVKLPSAEAARQAGIEIAQVESKSVVGTIVCNGRVGFNQNHYAQVRPRVDGIVRHIRVDVGAAVHGGDVLAVVDSPTLGDIKANYVYAIVNQDHFQEYHDRLKRLVVNQAVPTKNFWETEHLLQEAKIEVIRAKQKLINMGFSPGQMADVVSKEDTSTELTVAAPWDGVVVHRQAVEGEAVTSAAPLFAVADLATLWVHLSAYENDLPKIRLGQATDFVPDGLDGAKFEGVIVWISPEVDAQTRTIQVRAEVHNRDGLLRANMYGKGQIRVESSHEGLVVPEAAVQTHGAGSVVFVERRADEYEMRPVRVGVKGDLFWEVTSGLHKGERVATTGSFLLKSNLENESFGHVE